MSMTDATRAPHAAPDTCTTAKPAALIQVISPTMKSMRATDGLSTPPEALAVMKMMTVSTTNRDRRSSATCMSDYVRVRACVRVPTPLYTASMVTAVLPPSTWKRKVPQNSTT